MVQSCAVPDCRYKIYRRRRPEGRAGTKRLFCTRLLYESRARPEKFCTKPPAGPKRSTGRFLHAGLAAADRGGAHAAFDLVIEPPDNILAGRFLDSLEAG